MGGTRRGEEGGAGERCASDLYEAGERCASDLYETGERCASGLYRGGGWGARLGPVPEIDFVRCGRLRDEACAGAAGVSQGAGGERERV